MIEEGWIGPYRIERCLGFGRKSEVLLAKRRFLGDFERTVVVKRLLARCEDDPERQGVTAAEALAYARLSHPAIVQLFDVFPHEGHLALVLEYVDGVSLAKLLAALRARREPVGDRVALFIASRVFAALAAAHTAKDPRTGEPTPVIHRDVSPSNVLVPWDGIVKLGDFDLSKVIGVSGDTRGGLMKGTYGYMAPEQVTGDPVTPQTDVYAGCLLLREMLLGRPAFDERLPELELLKAMIDARLAPIDALRGGIPRRLASALRRGLSRDPARHTITAAEMVDVLRSYVDMDQAHVELVARLQRIRADRDAFSPPAPATTLNLPPMEVPLTLPTPRAMTISNVDSVAPVEEALPPAVESATRSRALVIGGWAAATAAMSILAATMFLQSPSGAPTTSRAPPPTTLPPRSADPPPAPIPPPVTAPPSPVSGGYGTIIPPAAAQHHRVWVDGEVVDLSRGMGFRLPCGAHVVRVGSAGASQSVDVPCGGVVTVKAE
jgi:serine/threonine-protein kinase